MKFLKLNSFSTGNIPQPPESFHPHHHKNGVIIKIDKGEKKKEKRLKKIIIDREFLVWHSRNELN